MAKTGPKQGTKNFNQKGFTKNLLSIMKNREQAVECCTPPPQSVDFQTFGSPTTAGAFTWNKPAGAKMVLVQMFAAGGSGANGAAFGISAGGGGYGEAWLPAIMLPDVVAVTVGAGGVGNSVPGGNTNFGTFTFVKGGAASTAGLGSPSVGTTASLLFNGGSAANSFTARGGPAGGTGGSASGGGNPGVVGGNNIASFGGGVPGWLGGNAGGLGGTTVSPNGQPGFSSPVGSIIAGTGGGGGASSSGGNSAGNGGAGGFPAGGGGQGGNGPTIGLGGNGGNGIILVTTFF